MVSDLFAIHYFPATELSILAQPSVVFDIYGSHSIEVTYLHTLKEWRLYMNRSCWLLGIEQQVQ